MARILIVEDEPDIALGLVEDLVRQGYDVETVGDGESAIQRVNREPWDLVVLDVMLPGRSGLDVLAAVSCAKPALPVIVLTARGGIEHRIAGLDAGAVDYLVKPFSLGELAARVRAQLRVAMQTPVTEVRIGDLQVDLLARAVRQAGGTVRLSSTEFELLMYLVNNRGRVLTREQILRAVWGYDHDPGTNVVDVYVGYLRRKLRRGDRNAPIVTIRSVGYRLDDAV